MTATVPTLPGTRQQERRLLHMHTTRVACRARLRQSELTSLETCPVAFDIAISADSQIASYVFA
jgi:hypothetical protein